MARGVAPGRPENMSSNDPVNAHDLAMVMVFHAYQLMQEGSAWRLFGYDNVPRQGKLWDVFRSGESANRVKQLT